MKFRKFFVFCFLTLFFVNSVVVNAVSGDFPDVKKGSLYYAPVMYLKEHSVIKGYDDGTFKPERPINRAEALKIIVKAFDLQAKSDNEFDFPDVNKEDWFFDYVLTAFNLDIVQGYDDGTFKPANNINVAESLKMILLSTGDVIDETIDKDPYPDVHKDDWYAVYAKFSKEKNVIAPQDDGLLHADRDITRGEFVQIIYRLMYMKENNVKVFPMSMNWPSYEDENLHIVLKYPFSWEKIAVKNSVILWKKDELNGQLSWARVYPNGATMTVVDDENKNNLSLSDYVRQLTYDESAQIDKLTLNNYPFVSVVLPNAGILDYYFKLPNNHILVVYCQVGTGENRSYLIDEIRNIVGTIRYVKNVSNSSHNECECSTDKASNDDLLVSARENILVPNKGKSTINLFNDATLIETDSIGIGTGPVDYYYSLVVDATFKLERNSDTLLAISNGKNTDF